MAKVELSYSAIKDLKSIYDYISVDSGLYAEQLVNKIYKRIKTLETHSHIGRTVPEFSNASIRELIEGNYRVIYKIRNEEKISVVRIFHRAQLLRSL